MKKGTDIPGRTENKKNEGNQRKGITRLKEEGERTRTKQREKAKKTRKKNHKTEKQGERKERKEEKP